VAYIGFHKEDLLPIKRGQVVSVPKGTPVKQVGKPIRPAGRTFKVKVDHLLFGFEDPERGIVQNPQIRWAGSGGYWCEADINLIPEANAAAGGPTPSGESRADAAVEYKCSSFACPLRSGCARGNERLNNPAKEFPWFMEGTRTICSGFLEPGPLVL
jgi:hypothetical protein